MPVCKYHQCLITPFYKSQLTVKTIARDLRSRNNTINDPMCLGDNNNKSLRNGTRENKHIQVEVRSLREGQESQVTL